MKYFQPKIFLCILVLLLSVTPQACFVEQIMAGVVGVFQHAQGDAHDHEKSSPAHHHDEKGNEEDFCCDNTQSTYLGSKSTLQFDWVSHLAVLHRVTLETAETHDKSLTNRKYIELRHEPKPSRARDQYALACLLHAPPLS